MLFRTFISAMLLIVCLPVSNAQHFTGEKKDDVRKIMKQQVRGLNEDRSFKNPSINMMKYTDRFGNQTMIFVFDDENKCKYSKHMCDYSMLDKKTLELNEKYTKLDDHTWTYKHEGSSYKITMKKGEWYFTLDTRKVEE